MSEPLSDIQIDQMIADFIDGSLRETDRPVFERWLKASTENPLRVARLSATDYAIRKLCQDTKADYLLEVLREIEDSAANIKPVSLDELRSNAARKIKADARLSTREIFSIAGYLAVQMLHTKAATIVSVAAAILIGTSTLIYIAGENNERPMQSAVTKHTKPQPLPEIVATLTAEHDAQWAQAKIAAGSDFYSGDRLTLTQGFAQIVTARGAVAILEAPATVEFLDSGNALYLHSGKLVGLCQTESSKGFVVRTDSGVATDLGTEFGIIQDKQMTVAVFKGEVAVTPASTTDLALRSAILHAGDKADVQRDQAVDLSAANKLKPGFVRSWESVIAPKLEGDIRYQVHLPSSFAIKAAENDVIQLFLEQADVTLTQDLTVTQTQPGRYEKFDPEQLRLPAGSHVDSYLVHYDVAGLDEEKPRRATIRFARPILGVIADDPALFASDAVFALPGTDFGPRFNPQRPEFLIGRGLEARRAYPGDTVEISEDRLTLTMELHGALAIDQIRVLVQSSPTAP